VKYDQFIKSKKKMVIFKKKKY